MRNRSPNHYGVRSYHRYSIRGMAPDTPFIPEQGDCAKKLDFAKDPFGQTNSPTNQVQRPSNRVQKSAIEGGIKKVC